MKKLILSFSLLAVIGLFAVEAQAQQSVETVKKECATSTEAAAKAAALDDNIEQRVCSKSGKVSYVRKSVCEKSGKVSFANVEYDSQKATFVNVSPTEEAKKACCAKGAKEGKACCAKGAKKACTKAQKAACHKKSATAKKTESESGEVKLISNEKE